MIRVVSCVDKEKYKEEKSKTRSWFVGVGEKNYLGRKCIAKIIEKR